MRSLQVFQAAAPRRPISRGLPGPALLARVSAPDIDARLMALRQQASNLQWFQLNAVIERMLADPRRILQVRKDLHLGQTVRFMGRRDGQMRMGTVVAMKDTPLTIQAHGTPSAWTMPCTAVEPPAPRAGGNNVRRGEKVALEDKGRNTVVGVIVRINQRTTRIDPGDDAFWREGFALLRHVVDI